MLVLGVWRLGVSASECVCVCEDDWLCRLVVFQGLGRRTMGQIH